MKRALVLALLVVLGASLAGPASAAKETPASTERLLALDQQILASLNVSRAKHGLRPVVLSSELQRAAISHSRAMLQGGFFAHDAPGGTSFVARVRGFYRSAGYNNWSVGENLLYSTQAVTAEAAIAAWLASPGHRENMLTPEWREVGIGALRANAAGGLFGGQATWVVTMDFGTRSGTLEKLAASATVKSFTATPGAKAKKSATAAKNQKPRQTTKATTAPSRKKTSAKSKTIVRILPQPSPGSDDENDDDPSADASEDEGDDPADDESGDDGIHELALRSG